MTNNQTNKVTHALMKIYGICATNRIQRNIAEFDAAEKIAQMKSARGAGGHKGGVWRKRKKREERTRKQHRSFDAILCRGLWPNRKSQVIAGSKSRQIVSSRQKSTRGVMSEIGIAQIDVWFRRYVVARPSRCSCLCRVCLQLFFDLYKILS